MEHYLNIFIKSIFIDNMVFAYFFGMCSYLAVSKKVNTAMGLGVAVVFVLAITVPVDYLLENFLLKAGEDITTTDIYRELVFSNGLKQRRGEDYNVTFNSTDTNVVFTRTLPVGTCVEVLLLKAV